MEHFDMKNNRDRLKKHFHLVLLVGFIVIYSAQCWKNTILNFDYRSAENNTILEHLSSVVETVQDNWSKNLYYQGTINHVNKIATYYAVGKVNPKQVSAGTENWLFYKTKSDGDPIADYEGTNSFTEEDIQKRAEILLKIQNHLSSQGVQFCLIIPPNKEHIYSEYMSREYTHSEISRTDLMIQDFKKQGIHAINPKKSLLEEHNAFQLYYPYDTHWSQLGGYIGTKLALQSFGIEIPALSEVKIRSDQKSNACDLAAMAGITNLLNDEIEYTVDGMFERDPERFEKASEFNAGSFFSNDDALYKKKVLLIGDSFRAAMTPTLVNYFSEVYSIHRNDCKPELLDYFSPDYVIIEYVERYSFQMIDFNYLGFID